MYSCLLCVHTMSQTATPITIAFDLQRTAIENTRDAVRRNVEAQRALGEAVFDVESATETSERSYEALATFVDVYFDAVAATTPGGTDQLADVRTAVEDQLATVEDNHVAVLEAFEANLAEGTEVAEDVTDEFLAALDEQFDAVLAANEDAEAETIEVADEVEAEITALVEEFEVQAAEVAEAFEAAIEQSVEQFETGATAVGEQVTEANAQVAEANADLAEAAQEQVAAQVEAADESLQAIDGLGSTYADRLREAGVDSLAALAEANVDLVAETAEVSETQAEKWIDAARQTA